MSLATLKQSEIIYPESDGSPMGESDVHISMILNLLATLRNYFRDEAQVYVAANMFLYYEEGDRSKVVTPDVFVVRGVSKDKRRTYNVWEEGQSPQLVFEISSRSTRLEDTGNKRTLYAKLGVLEYYIFDPYGEYLEPRLWAYRLNQKTMDLSRVRDNIIHSDVLGLDLYVEGNQLRLRQPQSGETLLMMQEAYDAHRAEAKAHRAEAQAHRAEAKARQAEAKARQAEAEARQRAEAEIARLQAELARLKADKDTPN